MSLGEKLWIFSSGTPKSRVRCSSWSKICNILHTSSRRSPFVRCSSRIRYTSLHCSSRTLYFFHILKDLFYKLCLGSKIGDSDAFSLKVN